MSATDIAELMRLRQENKDLKIANESLVRIIKELRKIVEGDDNDQTVGHH